MPVVELLAVLLGAVGRYPLSDTPPAREIQKNPGQLENRFTSNMNCTTESS